MGKGDKKSKRGKLFKGSYGITRPRDKKAAFIPSAAVKQTVSEQLPEEVKVPKPSAPKKEAKAKKAETT